MNLLLALALLLPAARADEVSAILAQAKEAAAQMPAVPAKPAAAVQLDGPKTWVFAVGALEFADAGYPGFPKADRRDDLLVQRFAALGVPKDHIVLVQDGAAKRDAVRASFKDMLGKAQPGDLLFFYYTGHGFARNGTLYVANYDSAHEDPGSNWSVASIVEDIEANFKGAGAILALEACYSGLAVKHAAAGAKRVGFGVLASTDEDTISTTEWTFSDALLKGLSGDASFDADKDGKITFGELGRGVQSAMYEIEDQNAFVSTTGGFDPNLKLAAVPKGK